MQCHQCGMKQSGLARFCIKCGTIIPNGDEMDDLFYPFSSMGTVVEDGCREAVKRECREHELRIALEIQDRLLPNEMPKIPGFEISGASLPSRQVACDYFDFLDIEKDYLGIAIGDVSAKGIPAALFTFNLQASLHGLVGKPDEVAPIIYQINNLLARSTDTNMFAKFFYGVLDRNISTFTFSNAGQNPPLLFRAEGKFERLETGGLIIGFLPNQEYEQRTVTINPGEVIVLYTDGITEAEVPTYNGKTNKLFGEERLIEVIQSRLDKTAKEIQTDILQAVTAHTDNSPLRDDIALVIVKRREG